MTGLAPTLFSSLHLYGSSITRHANLIFASDNATEQIRLRAEHFRCMCGLRRDPSYSHPAATWVRWNAHHTCTCHGYILSVSMKLPCKEIAGKPSLVCVLHDKFEPHRFARVVLLELESHTSCTYQIIEYL